MDLDQRAEKIRLLILDKVGNIRIYYQPPSTVKMEYPCIVYQLSRPRDAYADNGIYVDRLQWSLILISRSPTPSQFGKLRNVQSCIFDRHYTANNLHHYSFDLMY